MLLFFRMKLAAIVLFSCLEPFRKTWWYNPLIFKSLIECLLYYLFLLWRASRLARGMDDHKWYTICHTWGIPKVSCFYWLASTKRNHNCSLKYFYYTYLFDVYTHVYKCGHRGQMASCRNQFSYFTVWVLGIKFRSSDLAGSALTCWTILLASKSLRGAKCMGWKDSPLFKSVYCSCIKLRFPASMSGVPKHLWLQLQGDLMSVASECTSMHVLIPVKRDMEII